MVVHGGRKVVIDVILDDGTVAKGVADIDKRLGGISGTAQKSAFSIGKIVSALGLVALARKGIDLVRDSLQGAFKRIDTFEQFERVMNAVTGSTEETAKALDRTNEIVTGTAYTLDGAARAVQNFVTRGASVDDATKYIEAWGDAVAFYGDGSQEQFDNVNDALAKMLTKGTVGMDQLNRLFDAGIDAVGIYAQATGENASDVQNALSKGEISAEDFINTVSTAMLEGTNGVTKIAGAAKENGATWGSTFANMRAAVTRGVEDIIMKIDEMLESNGLPNMRQMVAEFGETFENVLSNAAKAIPDVVEKIKEVYENIKPWLPLLGSVAGGLLTAFAAFKAFEQAKVIITSIRLAFLALNGTMLANPIFWVVAAIVAAVALIYIYWEPISEFFMNLWESIKEIFANVYQWIDDKTGGAFSVYVELITRYMKMVWDNIKSVWDYVKNTFTNVLDFLKALVTGDFEGMKKAIQNQMENSRKLLSNILGNIKKHFGDILSKIWSNVKEKFENIKQSIRDKIQGAKTALVTKFQEMVSNARTKVQNILTTVRTTFQNMVNAVRDKINGVRDRVREGLNRALDIVRNIKDKFLQAGKNIVTSIADGIKSAIGKVTGAISDVATKVRNFLPFSPAKDGPLRDIHRLNFGGTIADSIKKGKAKALDAMRDLAGTLNDEISPDVGFVNRLRGVKAPLGNVMPISAVAATTGNQANSGNTQPQSRQRKEQPAVIQVLIGNQTFEGFVEDITKVQVRQKEVIEAFRR